MTSLPSRTMEIRVNFKEIDRMRRNKRRAIWALPAVVVAISGLLVFQWDRQAAGAASRTLLRFASQTDPYAELRTILRAYRTSANYDSEGRLEQAYGQYARTDRVIPDYTALPSPIPDRKPLPAEPPTSMAQKVSADGKTLVTTDPQKNATLWRIDGTQVSHRALGQRATRVTISRDGRYVAYLQDSFPTINRDDPRTACGAKVLGDCLYLYDTVTGLTRQLGTMDSSAFGEVPIIRFDPAGQVLAAVFSPEVFKQRVVTWDVGTGQQRDDITVPGGEMDTVHDMWLAPGGRRLLLHVELARRPGSRVFDGVLATVDSTGPSPVFTRMATDIGTGVAVSGDGGRLAALVSGEPLDVTHNQFVVWDVATGQKIAEGPTLPQDQSLGQPGLDLHGERVFITAFSRDVSIWKVGQPTPQPVTLHTQGWQDVLPLGSGEDTPLLMVDGDVVGVVLAVPGRQLPIQRLAAPLPQTVTHNSGQDAERFAR
jgi:hypothetical protein